MKLKISLFIAFLLFLYSCQVNRIDPTENTVPVEVNEISYLPVIQEGIYAFESYEQYWACRVAMAQASKDGMQYEDVLSSVGNFYSIAEAYEAISETDCEEIAQSFWQDGSLSGFEGIITIVPDQGRDFREEQIVVDPILRHLMNQYGMIQVGDSIWKHLFNYVVAVPASEELAVEALKNLTESSLTAFTYSHSLHKVEREIISSSQYFVRGQVDECTDKYDNDKKRVQGILRWYSRSGGVNGYSGQTKHAKKTLGIWFGKQVGELTVIGTGTVQWGGVTETVDVDASRPNKSKTYEYSFSQCSFCVRGPADIDGTHQCSCGHGCSTTYTY